MDPDCPYDTPGVPEICVALPERCIEYPKFCNVARDVNVGSNEILPREVTREEIHAVIMSHFEYICKIHATVSFIFSYGEGELGRIIIRVEESANPYIFVSPWSVEMSFRMDSGNSVENQFFYPVEACRVVRGDTFSTRPSFVTAGAATQERRFRGGKRCIGGEACGLPVPVAPPCAIAKGLT